MKLSARRIVFLGKQAGIGLAFVVLFPLSPELAIALAARYMEPIMPTATLPNRDASALAEAALRAMEHFHEAHRTEERFYLVFQTLSRHNLVALKRYYTTNDDWHVFRQICAFWGVAGAHRTQATRRLRAAYRQPSLFV